MGVGEAGAAPGYRGRRAGWMAGATVGTPGWREAGASVKAGRGLGRLSNKHYL